MRRRIVAAILVALGGLGVVAASSASSDPREKRPPVTVPFQANDRARDFNPGPPESLPANAHTRATIVGDSVEDIHRGGRP